jgi:acylphosphatase
MESERASPGESWLVRVRGRVQGVGYRWSCVQQARAQGLTGWVRNRVDGSVEALLQGTPEQLTRMCEWMRTGIAGARVDSLEVLERKRSSEPLDRFEQQPTA